MSTVACKSKQTETFPHKKAKYIYQFTKVSQSRRNRMHYNQFQNSAEQHITPRGFLDVSLPFDAFDNPSGQCQTLQVFWIRKCPCAVVFSRLITVWSQCCQQYSLAGRWRCRDTWLRDVTGQ